MAELHILIADDHEVFRHGLRGILQAQPGWKVVAEASNGRQAVQMTREYNPQVVVLDISMPELNGLEATREILKEMPGCEILIMTLHDSEEVVREVLKAGARGYVLKSDAAKDVVAAVDALRRHTTFFTSKVSAMILDGYLSATPESPKRTEPLMSLTARERQVVQLLAEGKSNKEVAVALGISVKTAETHRANVMNKLSMHSLSELVRYAIRNHITEG